MEGKGLAVDLFRTALKNWGMSPLKSLEHLKRSAEEFPWANSERSGRLEEWKTNILLQASADRVMVIGQLLAYTASEQTKACHLFHHSAEQRGARPTAMWLFRHEIGAARLQRLMSVILNEPSMDRFKNSVVSGGAVIVNSTIVRMCPN